MRDVVLLGSLGFDVLLDRVNLRLVGYQSLLLLIEPVVDVTLQNLVLARVVLHRVECRLLAEAYLKRVDHLLDACKLFLLDLELLVKLVGFRELVLDFVLHLLNTGVVLLELGFDRPAQVLVLGQVLLLRLNFDRQLRCCSGSVVHLALLEVQVLAHLVNCLLGRQPLLASKRFLHVHQQGFNRALGIIDLLVIALRLLLELLHVVNNLLLFLVKNLKLLKVLTAIFFAVFKVGVNVLDVSLVSLDSAFDLGHLLFLLLDLCVVVLDPVHQALTCFWERQIHLVGL